MYVCTYVFVHACIIQLTCCSHLAWSGSADRSRLGSLAGKGLGVRARGPVDTELTEPSGVKARGEEGSMKASLAVGVMSRDPACVHPVTQRSGAMLQRHEGVYMLHSLHARLRAT